ncbi:hypothetical protein COB64_02485 [Candidatus Wolfebacteria bacterium]|nr:MAG: hypothetical protein COB64_02485 [Candidatus Wolfebacteria bacterium]
MEKFNICNTFEFRGNELNMFGMKFEKLFCSDDWSNTSDLKRGNVSSYHDCPDGTSLWDLNTLDNGPIDVSVVSMSEHCSRAEMFDFMKVHYGFPISRDNLFMLLELRPKELLHHKYIIAPAEDICLPNHANGAKIYPMINVKNPTEEGVSVHTVDYDWMFLNYNGCSTPPAFVFMTYKEPFICVR